MLRNYIKIVLVEEINVNRSLAYSLSSYADDSISIRDEMQANVFVYDILATPSLLFRRIWLAVSLKLLPLYKQQHLLQLCPFLIFPSHTHSREQFEIKIYSNRLSGVIMNHIHTYIYL